MLFILNGVKMTKNPIQEKRMKEYFIQAACEIIRAEGIRALNVRTVSERAGYSFATLYNYFEDFKELVYHCVVFFLGECEQFIADSVKRNPDQENTPAITAKAYLNYFIQYPGTFELIYMERMSELNNDKIGELITGFRKNIFIESEVAAEKKVKINSETFFNLLNGYMMMYFFRRTPGSYKEFTSLTGELIDRFSW